MKHMNLPSPPVMAVSAFFWTVCALSPKIQIISYKIPYKNKQKKIEKKKNKWERNIGSAKHGRQIQFPQSKL